MRLVASVLILLATSAANAENPRAPASKLTVFVAKKIFTMEAAQPEATAVAVADGKIVSVGSLESLKTWIDQRGATIDRTFEDKVLMPGFIDPHVHPSLPAVVTQFPFLAPDDWSLPTGEFPGEKTPEGYLKRLKELVSEHDDADIPFIAWGYHQLWHGMIRREQLNGWFPDKPVMLWHRSFHEMIANDAAIEMLGLLESDFKGSREVNWEEGHFWENGLLLLLPKMPFLLASERYTEGMKNFVRMMQLGGVTSAMDMGIGIFGDPVGETALIHRVMDQGEPPSRLVLTPIITDFIARKVSPANALKQVEKWAEGNSERVRYDGHFKLMMDGAIYSGLSQYGPPGYLDGHEGMWMAPLETTYKYAEVFWNNGYQIHAHTNGDKSADALINIVSKLQSQKPRFDHRFALEHFAYATEDQIQRMHQLGMVVSANPYYQFILADVYADNWLGTDRARRMVPLNSAKQTGMRYTLHSDCPMAPLSPLTLVWTAVNRVTINGNRNAPFERISVEDALRAITIDAAWVMRWEDRIGSIRAGKLADFTVLEKNPYEVHPLELKDVPIWGVVYEGIPYANSDLTR